MAVLLELWLFPAYPALVQMKFGKQKTQLNNDQATVDDVFYSLFCECLWNRYLSNIAEAV